MPVLANMVSANVFIDNFNRANGSVGSNYDHVNTGLTVFNNQARGSNNGTLQTFSTVKTSVIAFNADQAASIVFSGGIGPLSDLAGPVVRFDSATGVGYYIRTDGGNFSERRIRRRGSGGTVVTIGTVNIVPKNGDTVKLTIIGSTISAYVNGTLIDSVSDSTYTTGQPGLFYEWGNTGAILLDNFIAADVPTTNAKTLFTISQTPVGKLIVGSQ